MTGTGWMQRAHEPYLRRWAAFGLAGALVHALWWWISEPAILFNDFYKAYWPAADLMWREGSRPPWPENTSCALGFVNIPVLAWLFAPLALAGRAAAGWVFLGIGIAAVAAAFVLILRFVRHAHDIGAGILFLFLVNGPLVNSLREGNSTHLVLFLLAAALMLLREKYDIAAGVMLGICAVFKLPFLLYGVYYLARRRWRVVAGGAAAVAGTGLLSLALFGLEINLDWYAHCVAPFVGQAVPAFNVQSIDGFVIRLWAGAAGLLNWYPVAIGPAQEIVRLALFGVIAAGAWMLARRAPADASTEDTGALSGRDVLEFVFVLNVILVASPVSWTHYYLLMLLPAALYLGGRLPLADDAGTRGLMGCSIFLASLPIVIFPIDPTPFGEFASRTLVSAWLFGGLLGLAALARGFGSAAGIRRARRVQAVSGS